MLVEIRGRELFQRQFQEHSAVFYSDYYYVLGEVGLGAQGTAQPISPWLCCGRHAWASAGALVSDTGEVGRRAESRSFRSLAHLGKDG